MRSKHQIHRNQQGLVSIFVSIVFIIIITLVTTSFALLMRREQRQALDRQLSTQAFYAAESGVNDAVEKVKGGTSTAITDCDDVSNVGDPDLGNNMSYTCVLLDQAPPSIQLAPISTDTSSIVRLQATQNIAKLKISWKDYNGSANFAPAGTHHLPQAAYYKQVVNENNFANSTGILRTTLIPIKLPITRSNLIDDSRTLFLYPMAGGSGTIAANAANQGGFADANCSTGNTPNYCNIEITNLSGLSTNIFYLRLKSIYQPSAVEIQAFNSAGDQMDLIDSQAVIDATGKANDVLRRIQVRVPLRSEFIYPEFAVESSDDLCKLLYKLADNTTIDACEPYN